jgi:hypothetical protein
MRTLLFFIFVLLFGTNGAAQELVGADRILPGTLTSFEIVPAQEVSWHIVTPSANTKAYQVDTGSSKIYFTSPEPGRFSIIAGIFLEGKPQLLIKTFINGEEDNKPLPIPTPPVPSLESWIRTQIPILVKSENFIVELRLVAECFEEIVRRIDEGNIKTAQNARTQLQITLTGTQTLASPTAVTDWTPFLMELSRRLEAEFGEKNSNLIEVNKIFQNISHVMRSLELFKSILAPLQNINRPTDWGMQNRIFGNFFRR